MVLKTLFVRVYGFVRVVAFLRPFLYRWTPLRTDGSPRGTGLVYLLVEDESDAS
jgi:hypothetical protein